MISKIVFLLLMFTLSCTSRQFNKRLEKSGFQSIIGLPIECKGFKSDPDDTFTPGKLTVTLSDSDILLDQSSGQVKIPIGKNIKLSAEKVPQSPENLWEIYATNPNSTVEIRDSLRSGYNVSIFLVSEDTVTYWDCSGTNIAKVMTDWEPILLALAVPD